MTIDGQLRRVELRLLARAGGDPALEREIRRYFADSCARFDTARVRQFVPILVEREVRDRLRAEDHPVERCTARPMTSGQGDRPASLPRTC